MFQAVYIADASNNLIFEYLINLSSPSFNSLKNLLQYNADEYLMEINQDYFIVWQKFNNIIIYILCSNLNSPPPVMPYEFINRLIDVISNYFGTPVSISKIDANNDTLTLLINEMIDDGIPITTDSNQLKELVPFKSLFSKILNSANTLTNSAPKPNPLAQTNAAPTIPWRRANVKYTNNEMYLDVIESINIILKPETSLNSSKLLSSKAFDSAFYSFKSNNTLIPITGTIDGQINFLSHLSGVPQLLLNVSIPNLKLLPSFHQCIDVDKWNANGSLSFIPADGTSTLMNYQIDIDSTNNYLGLVEIDYQTGLGILKNEFEIKLFIKDDKLVSKIENLSVEIFCHNTENDEEDSENVDESSITNIKSNRLTHGDFSYKGKGRAEWNLRNVSTGIQPLIHGSLLTSNLDLINPFESDDKAAANLVKSIEPIYIKLNYEHKGSVPSGLKVDGLKLVSSKGMPDAVKPYKGVKYITKTGDFIVRT